MTVLLGSRIHFPTKMFNRTLYLGITIDGGNPSTTDVEMRPRQAILPMLATYVAADSQKLSGRGWNDILVTGSDPTASKIRADKVALSHF